MTDLSMINLIMQVMLVAWIWLSVLIVRRTIARNSIGLPTALVLTMSVFYGGCFVYAVPGYTHLRADGYWYILQYNVSEWMIVQATFVSLLGLLGLAIGCGVWSRRSVAVTEAVAVSTSPSVKQQNKVLVILSLIGLTSYVLHSLDLTLPMLNALLETGRNIAIVAIALGMVLSVRRGKSPRKWMLAAALIPLYYFSRGFMSFSLLLGVVLLAFWMAQLQERRSTWSIWSLWRVALFVIAIQVFVTLFIAWFTFRTEIRMIIWQGADGSILETVFRAITETEMFSLWNFGALDLINIRLNVGIFIGRMIEQHEMFPELRQYGATLSILPLVLVPRFLWPGKPTRGGSDFVAEHTGLVFHDTGTTFPAPPVFEFYVNFGYLGVFVGFIVLGMILSRLDRAAVRHLNRGHYMNFARMFVVGLVLIDPLQRSFFMFNSAIFAWIFMSILKILIQGKPHAKPRVAARRPRVAI